MSKPELDLIQALNSARQALQEERQALVARIAVIDRALCATPTSAQQRAPKTTKGTSIREEVLVFLKAGPKTMKEIQGAVPTASPNSVQSVVYGLVSSEQISKDDSVPKKFSLTEKPKTNGAKRATVVV